MKIYTRIVYRWQPDGTPAIEEADSHEYAGAVALAGKGGGSPPPAPAPIDPRIEIQAQAASQPSVVSPFGTSRYSGDPNVVGSFTRTDELSPEQRALYDERVGITQDILGRSRREIGQMPISPQFRGAEDPTTNAVYNAQVALLNKSFDRDRTALEQRLANQGLPMGSQAYRESVDDFDTSKANALSQAAAGAISQGFQQDLQSSQQAYNRVAAALGGQQLVPVGSGGSPINVAGAYQNYQNGLNQQYQSQLDAYNAGIAGQNSTLGTIGQLGAAAITKWSDRRLKSNIERIGTHPLGIGIYAYDIFGHRDIGVMADEVETVMPQAVLTGEDGFKMVNYAMVNGG